MRNHALGVMLSLAIAGTIVPAARAQDTEEHSYVAGVDDNRLYDDELIKCLKTELGDVYQNLQIVVSACFSGGFASAAEGELAGNWSVNTARDIDHSHTYHRTTDPNNMKGGETGLKIGNKWYHGWKPQWIKQLNADKDSTSQALADYAKTHDHLVGGNPQFKFAGTGNASKVHDGVKSNHALIWSSDADSWEADLMGQLITGLEAAGYDKDTIDYAYGNEAGQKVNGKDVDRNATKANLKQMLKDLRTDLNAHPGEEKAFIYLNSHGGTERRKAEKKEQAVEETGFQGKKFTDGASTTLELSPKFADLLLEETVLDDPGLTRFNNPALEISTTEEAMSGLVDVFIDGVQAGSLVLQGEVFGADYSIELQDAVMFDLAALGALDDQALEVSFQFDDPENMFRVATEWDFALDEFNLSHYGIGLATGAFLAKVPVPGTAVLVVLGSIVMIRRTRNA